MPGYSGTPLARTLGIVEGSVVALIGAPDGVFDGRLPEGISLRSQAKGRADVVVAFYIQRARLERAAARLGEMVFPAGGLWVAWPKRSSGVRTDMTEHVTREILLPLGLVDNKVCAIDDTWTGFRYVWRLERRRP